MRLRYNHENLHYWIFKKAAFYYDAEIKLFNCSRNVVFFVNQIKLKLASIKVSNEHQDLLT